MSEFDQAQARGRAAWEAAVQAKRVAIYARISKPYCNSCGHPRSKHAGDAGACCGQRRRHRCDCQAYSGQDETNQLLELRQYVERQGWTLVGEYIDRQTAKNADRESLQAMFAAAAQHKIDMVLFWSLDRFSREGVLATLKQLEQLNSCGVGWKSYTEQYLDSCGLFKDAVLSILATIAKQERIRISERVHAGLARVRAEGKILGRPRAIFDKQVARDMLAAGGTYRTVAAELGVSTAGLHGVLNPRKRKAG
jgi:DNA invertase Pin-like site-specific DNA recombinase